MKKSIYFILIPVLLFYCVSSCRSQYKDNDPLEGRYRMIKENNYKVHLEEFTIYKEYKDGKFIDYKLSKGNKKQSTRFSGEYYIINDSIYVEYLDEDNVINDQLKGEAYAFKYSLKNDTLTQEGEVYLKINGAKNNFYYGSHFKTYYLKVNE